VIVVFPAIRNTWLYVLFLRALGAKIGEGTYVNTNWISDAHLIEIGSGTMIGWDAILDPHSSENGRTIFQRIKIGNNVSIGMRTIILPGAVLEDDVIVGANSVVLKGQVLLAGGLYIGSPARPI
jgi:acetyltransferase-like isoleucine patch superfamily enzyme